MHEKSPRSVRLAPGVALYATEEGLVARTPRRWVRVDLHDRPLEADLVRRIASASVLVDATTAAAIGAMERAGLLVSDGALVLAVDCGDSLSLPADLAVRTTGLPTTALDDVSTTFVLAGAPDDAALGALVTEVVERGRRSLVVWVDERGVAIAHDDGARRGCALCAWLQDSALARYVAPGLALDRGPRAIGGASALWLLASSMVASIVGDPDARPAPGEVWVFDHASASAAVHAITPHPACACSSRAGRHDLAPEIETEWSALAARRFAPVWPVERASGARPARVVYRRSRTAWAADSEALGVALGSGEVAEVRALAEAVERFCLLHAPPDARSVAARDLDGEALSADAIRSLTFRDVEYGQSGFRYLPFAEADPIDWSIAHDLSGARRIWVPTSLVGRVPRRAKALVDATSNGYACHHDRETAITSALLELVERDAVLLHWYARLGALPRIEVELGIEGAVAVLATSDIALPVVLAIACQPGGSLRCGSAAAACIDDAVEHARSELAVALQGAARADRGAASMSDVAHRYQPDDHLRYYAGQRGAETYARLLEAPTIGMAELRERWPTGVDVRRAVERALSARSLTPWIVDRSLPAVFGARWHVVRALVPGMVELSWGMCYRRLASSRLAERLVLGATPSGEPHPIA